MLKIFPVVLMMAGAAVFAGGFAVSAHVVDDSNVTAMLSHCDNAEVSAVEPVNAAPQNENSGGIRGFFDKLKKQAGQVSQLKEQVERAVLRFVQKNAKPLACAAAEKDLAQLKTEMRALFAQINDYVRLLGRGVSLFGVVLVLIGASNLAAVWRK